MSLEMQQQHDKCQKPKEKQQKTLVSIFTYIAEVKIKPFVNNLLCMFFFFFSRETKGKRIIICFNNRIIKEHYTSAAKCLAYGRNANKARDKHPNINTHVNRAYFEHENWNGNRNGGKDSQDIVCGFW